MTPLRWDPVACPACNRALDGLGRWCPDCEAYTEDMVAATTDTTPPKRDLVTVMLPWSALASDNLRKGLEPAKWSEYKRARDTASAKAREQLGPGVRFPDHPIRVRIGFWLPDARRRDPNNLTKLIADALSGVAYGDDSQIRAMSWTVEGTDRLAPRAEITVTELEAA